MPSCNLKLQLHCRDVCVRCSKRQQHVLLIANHLITNEWIDVKRQTTTPSISLKLRELMLISIGTKRADNKQEREKCQSKMENKRPILLQCGRFMEIQKSCVCFLLLFSL